jgi:hypothetical protein
MLLVAFHAVATSPPMPGYARYVDAVKAQHHPGTQPRSAEMLDGLLRLAPRFPAVVGPIRSRRLAAALVSFTDDHQDPFPAEAFDDRAVRALIDGMTGPETVLSLLERTRAPTFLDAVLVVHAALRQLARGRDGRALPSCRLTLDERLAIGRCVLPFAPEESRGGDPLGDAYHYAANLAAGLAAASDPRAAWLAPLFAAGPELMWGVRQEAFGSVLFFGNHASIDRMALRHGLRVGRANRRRARLSEGT